MLLVLTIALFVGLASSQPGTKAIGDINTDKFCGCSEEDLPQCGCCVDLQEISQELNYTVCANMTYVEAVYGLRVTVTVNDAVWFNETLSGKNPPPLCRGLVDVLDICVQFYNISYEEDQFGGCMRIYADVVEPIFDIKLGCYYMQLSKELEIAVNEQARALHSLFKLSNKAKDLILDEMHKWSNKRWRSRRAFCLCGFVTSSQLNEIQAAGKRGILHPVYVGKFTFIYHTKEEGKVMKCPQGRILFQMNRCGCTKEPVPQCGCCAEFEFEEKEHKGIVLIAGIRVTVIYDGDVLFNETISVLDIKFGCFYLPMDDKETLDKALLNYMGWPKDGIVNDGIVNDIQQWFQKKLNKMNEWRNKQMKPAGFPF
ncbi:hypothetical protein OS493_031890 [Desmophyllum pertusum]|uniref:DUF4773 domain-containing protein n=1 Tax=Desmophyllum pertusum TaxID=174260 RepID=A0A9W9Y8C3_9CNID|nr:hypothetical protein OS493_031890 [Desmophyllum pertusum]